MNKEDTCSPAVKGISFFERYLTVWVGLCIVAGIALGKLAPGFAEAARWHGDLRQRRASDFDPDRTCAVFHDVSDHGQD